MTSRTQDIVKTIESVHTYKTIDNKNAFYAINYEEGGFTVLSADDRVSPILAFSEEGKFSNNIDEIPDPVVSWIETERESIKEVKDNNMVQLLEIHLEWDYLLTTSGNPNLCETLFLQKGPHLQTEWGQGEGFNNLIPYFCPNTTVHYAAGCVPVAMAQVMKYYQWPNYYNWQAMPESGGNFFTQRLIYDIGLAVETDYGCASSSTNSDHIPERLTGTFGYNYAQYSILYNPTTIYNQIAINRPVILTGGTKRNGTTYPWNYYTDGHAWVSDGFVFLILKARDANGACQTYGLRMLHMNWGWADSGYNGWYNENNFNPGTNTFDYRRGTVYIYPY